MKHNIGVIKLLLFVWLMPVNGYLFGAAAPIAEEERQIQKAIKRSLESGTGVAQAGDLLKLGLTPQDIQSVMDIHAFIRILDGKRRELGQNWQQYSQCQINTLKQNIEYYIARVHELRGLGNQAASETLGFSVAGLLAALSNNKVFFSGNLRDYMLALNGVRVGDDKLISKRKLTYTSLVYPLSSYQIHESCGYHALANAFAIGSLLKGNQALTSQAIQQRAENIIINNMVPRYGDEVVCQSINFDNLSRQAAALSPIERITLSDQNLFILDANPEADSIFGEQTVLEGGMQSITRAVKNTIAQPSSPTFFAIFWKNHWTLAAVIKNLAGEAEIIYLDSRNSQLEPEIEGALGKLDNFIGGVLRPKPNANIALGAGSAGGAAAPTARLAEGVVAPTAGPVEKPGLVPVGGPAGTGGRISGEPGVGGQAGGLAVGEEGVLEGVQAPVQELTRILEFINGMVPQKSKKLEQYKQNPPQTIEDKDKALQELKKMEKDIGVYKRDIALILANVLAGGEGGGFAPMIEGARVPLVKAPREPVREREPGVAAPAPEPVVQPAAAPEQPAGGWLSWMPAVSGYVPAWLGGGAPGSEPAPGQ